MRQVKNVTSTSLIQTLYYSLFYPHIDYGIILWGGANKSTIHPLSIMQKKAVRLITASDYNAHTTPLFAKTKILKIQDIYELHLAKFIYCLYNNIIPSPLSSFFATNSSVHDYSTRNCDNPRMPKHRTCMAARSIFRKSYHLWYNMEQGLKNSTSFNAFTNKYKKNIFLSYV